MLLNLNPRVIEYCIPFQADDALDSLDDHLKIKARYNVFKKCIVSGGENGGERRERRSPIFLKVTLVLQKLKSKISSLSSKVGTVLT